jgi:sugar lactone lactonase YvrE
MRLLRTVILTLVISCCAFGQTYTINTFAGGVQPVNIPATSANLSFIPAVAVDSPGNIFFIVGGCTVLRSDAQTQILTLVAGNFTCGFSGDNGPAASANLSGAQGIAVDSAGNVYVADTGNNRIRRISNGVITTVAGKGVRNDASGDNGPAVSADLFLPYGVAVDSAGDLYIADYGNSRVRKVSHGVITTVAGNGTQGTAGDGGPATSAQLYNPSGVAVDSAGDLYIADESNASRIRKVAGGIISTVAGGGELSDDNVLATSAYLNVIAGLAVDSAGNVYIAAQNNSRVRKVTGGVIATVAGNGLQGFSGDNGPATNAQLTLPQGVTVDSAGNLYIADTYNSRIRKVSNGVITTVAGGGAQGLDGFSGDNGPATSASLDAPMGLAVDEIGDLYIADTFNNRIRKVSNGVITTVAGNGTAGFSGDYGPATSAQLNIIGYTGGPVTDVNMALTFAGVAVDSVGDLYISDTNNNRVRKVSAGGVITTVAGGGSSLGDNGPATSAQLKGP